MEANCYSCQSKLTILLWKHNIINIHYFFHKKDQTNKRVFNVWTFAPLGVHVTHYNIFPLYVHFYFLFAHSVRCASTYIYTHKQSTTLCIPLLTTREEIVEFMLMIFFLCDGETHWTPWLFLKYVFHSMAVFVWVFEQQRRTSIVVVFTFKSQYSVSTIQSRFLFAIIVLLTCFVHVERTFDCFMLMLFDEREPCQCVRRWLTRMKWTYKCVEARRQVSSTSSSSSPPTRRTIDWMQNTLPTPTTNDTFRLHSTTVMMTTTNRKKRAPLVHRPP